jgi:hypothetical protein
LKEDAVKFYKSLFHVLFLFSLTTFVVGCGDSEVSSGDDPVMSNPDSDPTIPKNIRDESHKSNKASQPAKK